MSFSSSVRQLHRWVSVLFALAVLLVSFLIFTGDQEPAEWVYLLPLVPLALLAITGLYLFVLPYTARGRSKAPSVR